MKKLKRFKSHSAGFTLIELMVVMIIIGILAAFGLRSYFKNIDTARFNEAMTAMANAAAQVEAQFAKNGVLPDDQTAAAWAFTPRVDGFDLAYTKTGSFIEANRKAGDYSGSKLTFTRGSAAPYSWCWKFTGAGGITVADTPVSLSKCCVTATCN